MLTLELLSYYSIRHQLQRKVAIDILTLNMILNEKSKYLLSEFSRRKFFHINKTDKLGLEFVFLMRKQTGYIRLYIKKKRSMLISMFFMDKDLYIAEEIYFKSCNDVIVKLYIGEYDEEIIDYIYKNRMSNKLKDIKSLTKKCMNSPDYSFSVNIDIPGYVCII